MRPLVLTFGGLGMKSSGTSTPPGEQFVAGFGFARRFGHDEGGRIAAAGHVTGAGEDAVVTHDAVVVRIAQRVADAHHVVVSAEFDGTGKAARIQGIAVGHDHVHVAGRQHIGRGLDLFFREHRGLGHEGGDGFVGDGGDRRLERLTAHARQHPRGVARRCNMMVGRPSM